MTAARGPVGAPLALLLVCLSACDVDEGDIALDDAGAGVDGRMDAGHMLAAFDSGPGTGRSRSGAPREGGLPVFGDGDGQLHPNNHPAPSSPREDASITMNPGPDATVDDDAGDLDGGDEDGGTDAHDPCRNGHFHCVRLRISNLKIDFNATAGQPSMRTTVDGYTFEATGANGAVEFLVPADVVFHLYLTQPGTWPTDMQLKLPGNTDLVEVGLVSFFTDNFFAYYFGLAGQSVDSTKGMVLVEFAGVLAGAGVMLNHPGSPSVVTSPSAASLSNVLLADSYPFVNTINVEPGTFTPTPISPPGYDCKFAIEPGYPLVAAPRTVTYIPAICFASPP